MQNMKKMGIKNRVAAVYDRLRNTKDMNMNMNNDGRTNEQLA